MMHWELQVREEHQKKLWKKVQRYRSFIRYRGQKDGADPNVIEMQIKTIDRGE